MKYITTPIFYSNSSPHLGHLYSSLIVDIWKKGANLLQEPSFFVSGMDEHGQKVSIAAQNKGYNTQDHVNKVSEEFLDFFYEFSVTPEKWIRTTSKEHKKAVVHFWQILEQKKLIYKGTYEGWYSINDETYLLNLEEKDKQNKNIIWRHEECYYFKLSSFEKQIKAFYKKNLDFIFPKTRYNEVIGFLDKGLEDFVISRPKERMDWGIEVPNDSDHTIYVWFDALISYLSAAGYPDEDYKKYWPAIHVLGKDILKFHAIYWLAMLFAADIEPPEKMIVHGWWLNGDEKISKSLNNAIDLIALSEKYQTDGVRYYLTNGVKLGNDAEFKEDLLKTNVYSDLANKYGNLFLRILGMIEQLCDNEIKDYKVKDEKLIEITDSLIKKLRDFYAEPVKLNEYISSFIDAVVLVGKFLDENKVWKIEDKVELTGTLYFVLDIFRKITIIAWPILPQSTTEVLNFLKLKPLFDDYNTPLPNTILSEKFILFPK